VVLYLHSVAVVVIGSSFCSGTVRDFASITKFWNADGSLGPMLVHSSPCYGKGSIGGVPIGDRHWREWANNLLIWLYFTGGLACDLVVKRMSKCAENLPDDPAELKVMIAELQAENTRIEAENVKMSATARS
jgi:hypothetical protein